MTPTAPADGPESRGAPAPAPAPAPALVWCPFARVDDARSVARSLLDEGLIACANIVPGMETLHAWNGVIEQVCEAGVLFKTNAALLDKVMARIAVLHPYQQPTVLGWHCDAASPATAAWLGGLTG